MCFCISSEQEIIVNDLIEVSQFVCSIVLKGRGNKIEWISGTLLLHFHVAMNHVLCCLRPMSKFFFVQRTVQKCRASISSVSVNGVIIIDEIHSCWTLKRFRCSFALFNILCYRLFWMCLLLNLKRLRQLVFTPFSMYFAIVKLYYHHSMAQLSPFLKYSHIHWGCRYSLPYLFLPLSLPSSLS